jgi:hypothetical protein
MNTFGLWKIYSRIPRANRKKHGPFYIHAYQHLLFLMGIPKEQLDEMMNYDREELDFIEEEERYYNMVIKPKVVASNAEFREENKEFFLERREEYIRNEIKKSEAYLSNYEWVCEGWKEKGYSILERVFLDGMLFGDGPDKVRQWLKKMKGELEFRGKDNILKGGISREDIGRAEQYPMENLIEFNRSRMTRCPFHNEKTPSCSLVKDSNVIHCFGCGGSWNSIEVAMKKYGIAFVEAVKRLNNLT